MALIVAFEIRTHNKVCFKVENQDMFHLRSLGSELASRAIISNLVSRKKQKL